MIETAILSVVVHQETPVSVGVFQKNNYSLSVCYNTRVDSEGKGSL